MPAYHLPSIEKIAEALGGNVTNGEALVPGPGHTAEDRSLAIKCDIAAPDGFVVHSFAGDDPIACRDYVKRNLGLPEFAKKKAGGSSSNNKKGNGPIKAWSPVVARYVYRQADGTPYLQVCRTAAKGFFQNKWNGQMWVTGWHHSCSKKSARGGFTWRHERAESQPRRARRGGGVTPSALAVLRPATHQADHARTPGNPAEPSGPSIRCVMGRWGKEMKVLSDPACKQCGGRMEMVADISPQSRESGLRAFVCSECGTVESVQIDPDNHFGPKMHRPWSALVKRSRRDPSKLQGATIAHWQYQSSRREGVPKK